MYHTDRNLSAVQSKHHMRATNRRLSASRLHPSWNCCSGIKRVCGNCMCVDLHNTAGRLACFLCCDRPHVHADLSPSTLRHCVHCGLFCVQAGSSLRREVVWSASLGANSTSWWPEEAVESVWRTRCCPPQGSPGGESVYWFSETAPRRWQHFWH